MSFSHPCYSAYRIVLQFRRNGTIHLFLLVKLGNVSNLNSSKRRGPPFCFSVRRFFGTIYSKYFSGFARRGYHLNSLFTAFANPSKSLHFFFTRAQVFSSSSERTLVRVSWRKLWIEGAEQNSKFYHATVRRLIKRLIKTFDDTENVFGLDEVISINFTRVMTIIVGNFLYLLSLCIIFYYSTIQISGVGRTKNYTMVVDYFCLRYYYYHSYFLFQ